MNSTHKVEIVPVVLEKHPNADTLSLVHIFDHYVVVVRTADWEGKNIGAYIPPDSIVPDTPEYSFLKGSRRIRAKQFRGIQSQGMLMPAPEGAQIGDDVASIMGITHWEPPIDFTMGDAESDPPIPGQKYDIDSWFRYGNLLKEGTIVEITEKIHGTNCRITWQDGRLWVGSRSQYVRQSNSSLYWLAVQANSWIVDIARSNEGMVFYGEVFGWVQSLRYGATKSTPPMLRIFDIFANGKFLNTADRMTILRLSYSVQSDGEFRLLPVESSQPQGQPAPVLYWGPYSVEKVNALISGQSTVIGPGPHYDRVTHYREGIVIKPVEEQWTLEIGRLILKAVSPEYLEKSK